MAVTSPWVSWTVGCPQSWPLRGLSALCLPSLAEPWPRGCHVFLGITVADHLHPESFLVESNRNPVERKPGGHLSGRVPCRSGVPGQAARLPTLPPRCPGF